MRGPFVPSLRCAAAQRRRFVTEDYFVSGNQFVTRSDRLILAGECFVRIHVEDDNGNDNDNEDDDDDDVVKY